MKKLFVDTSAWVAVVNRRDQYHTIAAPFYKKALKEYGQLLTTNLVAAETYVLLRLDSGLDVALGWWEKISASLKIQVVYIDSDITTEAVKLLRKFDDQTFSLTDAVSFKVMERGGIEEAFAFDVHFKVAGFTMLP
ncbi:DNA-binding protein [Moorella thermoacetica]|uniref:23S rRNA-specific endonuclease VapC20 n=3 Tax=Neomoorella thermoacetica TaxID=1525 RepID=A0A1D7XC63_NEOTH|nr:PIN domain-containing protein [Moorella thermoacetica]AKX94574.1 ribonuclease VapC20 [Moorella thermoacetica]AKX97210.1 ribonuclease VapC20 [Moorella thermoacetica]AOQ24515.1 Ribonuclease VapC20 [Moorella thermoacetica]OIQ09499.1 ribonuclease VapC20 [Moorella thermoacetica]OIQ11844.1 ribonuclease VapC20 [Moorella thermoacetica]